MYLRHQSSMKPTNHHDKHNGGTSSHFVHMIRQRIAYESYQRTVDAITTLDMENVRISSQNDDPSLALDRTTPGYFFMLTEWLILSSTI